ncbi:MAG: hypothetical protein EB149_06485 [Thaumarchaeota archaeon]|nr:hypothetical protein [Nitrososphaerota archaeon]NDF25615.1 hypothetical protein [Nitrososphaerota archaeon]NDF27535.1 hypothetical protein [Nitrosopumilaceae archaeon]
MNKLTKVALCSAIFAVSMGVLSLNGFSGLPLATASQQTTSGFMPMLGHVEYTVKNSEGLVTAYYQGDNKIVDGGDRCAAAKLFNSDASSASNFQCAITGGSAWTGPGFAYIGIGNGTSAIVDTSDSIGAPALNTVGEMARVQGTVTATTNTQGVVVTITNSGHPFAFKSGVANQNATGATSTTNVIKQAGLFNSTGSGNTGSATSHTTAFGANSRMFAAQDLSPQVTVSNGDTLTVTWTVTIGSSS